MKKYAVDLELKSGIDTIHVSAKTKSEAKQKAYQKWLKKIKKCHFDIYAEETTWRYR